MAKTLDFFNGLVELAKAGYKPNDVKELLELSKTNSDLEADSASALNQPKPSEADKKDAANDKDAIAAIIERENKGE